ncbi:transporter [Limnochorda pilosa]|uniref:Transporter n=2 Tax=Limnochorda pilosa TaxID=1555112 RepID=A0A0K2SR02_LIMPI|nr:transporter [Limnochorda pilosa]
MVVALAEARSVPGLAGAGLLVAAGALAGAVSSRVLLRAARLVLMLLLVTLATHLLLTPGEPWLRLGPLVATREGLQRGLLLGARLALLALAGALVTATTSPLALSRGLERLLSPLGRAGVRVPDLSLVLAIALQFIPILAGEAYRLRLARQARGEAVSGAGSWRRALATASVLVPLFASALRRADRLAEAMEARGYRGAPRSSLRPYRWRAADWLVVGPTLLLAFWLGLTG